MSSLKHVSILERFIKIKFFIYKINFFLRIRDILVALDLLNKAFTLVKLESTQSPYERWNLVGTLFVLLNIGEFKEDILSITDPLSEPDLPFALQAFSSLVDKPILAEYHPKKKYWTFQVLNENLSLDTENLKS